MALLPPKYLQAEQHVEEMSQRVAWYVKEYINAKQRGTNPYSILTLEGYLYSIIDFFEWLLIEGILPYEEIADISLQDLEKLSKETVLLYTQKLGSEVIPLKNRLPKKRTKVSIARTLQALRSLFKYLTVETEDKSTGEPYFYRNVMLKINVPVEKETRNRRSTRIDAKTYKPNEIADFLTFAEHDYVHSLNGRQLRHYERDKARDLAILYLLFGSGIRGSECLSLQLDNIYQKDGYIDIVRKGDKYDAVAITKDVFTYLNQYLEVRGAIYGVPNDYPLVFVSKTPDGALSHMSNQSLLRMVKRYTKAYGKEITPHKARYSFSKHYIQKGGTLIGLRNQLGHTNIETTSLYVTEGMEEQKNILNKMSIKS